MVFTKRLRDGVRRGEITCSVRIWTRPHVKVGARYPRGDGQIEVDSIQPIGLPDITPQLARESGFLGVVDLLKVAKHGKGENIYLVRFHYVRSRLKRAAERKPAPKKTNTRTERDQMRALVMNAVAAARSKRRRDLRAQDPE